MPGPVQLRAPTPDLSARIAARIVAYAQDPASPYHDAAARHGALLLHFGWGTDFAIRPDGTVIRIDEVQISGPDEDIWYRDFNWPVATVAFAVSRYPELKLLLPPRPDDAVDCPACGGRGMIPFKGVPLLCECLGLGWVVPEENACGDVR
jgi:hypothetical protein